MTKSTFNEANTSEQFIIDHLTPMGWEYVGREDLFRDDREVLVESLVQEHLARLNPEIAPASEQADEVIYHLRLILQEGRSNLVAANEMMMEWLRGDKTMPFGPDHEHVPVRLIDFDNPANNSYIITQQYTYTPTPRINRRPDLVLLINGIPVIVGEVKTPVRPAVSWMDGAKDFVEDYWQSIPGLFVPNVFCFASEGKSFRYAAIHSDYPYWLPWRKTEDRIPNPFEEVKIAVEDMLQPKVVLDLLRHFTIFPTDASGRKSKRIARYQQYEAAKQICQRVVEGRIKRGLIWHFQGSGKSLLMVFTAQLLKAQPRLRNPTVIIVVDRKNLNTQLAQDFDAAQVPNTAVAKTREELERLLRQDTRQTLITTIFRFAEMQGVINSRDNIVVLVDEAHRTQEGDLGMKMRQALPNAFLFGLTGTPISRRDKNTFKWFGTPEDDNHYLNYYSYQQAVNDQATLPVHFEPRLVDLRVDRNAIDEAFEGLLEDMDLDDDTRADLSRRAGKLQHLLKAPQRLNRVAHDIAEHYQQVIEPSGFKGMVVVYDREAVVMMYLALRHYFEAEALEVIMITQGSDLDQWRGAGIDLPEEDFARFVRLDSEDSFREKTLSHYRDPKHPLKLLIVTSKLLTGFDAPICKAMYLDKPLRDHTLLQAICRTNRLFPGKNNGLIIDYLGVFDDVAKAMDFDKDTTEAVISNIEQLFAEFPEKLHIALNYFPHLDRSIEGYAGLMPALDCLKDTAVRDEFAKDYGVVSRYWETLSPDERLGPYHRDYKWLSQVYEAVQPVSGIGKLIWQQIGPKTIELIHENTFVDSIRTDLETLILDDKVLELLKDEEEAEKEAQQVHITIARRLRQRKGPEFEALGERLERLKEKYELGVLDGIEWLKDLLKISRDVLRSEQENQVQIVENRQSALTEIFLECRVKDTPEMIAHIVTDIDTLVKATRFQDWQNSSAGEREVRKVLRKVLMKYSLHKDHELFERSYEYIRQHY